jgi:hypothetical protein
MSGSAFAGEPPGSKPNLAAHSATKPTPEAEKPAAERLGPLFHPDGPGRLRWRVGVGALLDILPRRVVESEQRPFPLLTGMVRLGLPVGFSIDLKASAIYVSNEIDLGVGWSYRIKRFSIGLQDHAGI